jgi:hypothetical protein
MRCQIGALLALAVLRGPAHALDATADPSNFIQPAYGQSLFFFAGRTSPTNLEDTAAFNLTRPRGTASYDNAIVGAAYQRDFLQIGGGVFLGGEIGIANRFGYYKVCCDPTVRTSDVNHSGEVWSGVSLRLGTHKGDSARIGFVIQRLQREAIDESGSFLAFGAAVRTD